MKVRLLLILVLLLGPACAPPPDPSTPLPTGAGLQVEIPRAAGREPDPRSVEAVSAARAGRTDEALETARSFAEAEPDNPEAWALLAVLQQATGRLNEAARSADRAADLAPHYEALLVQTRMRGGAGQALVAARALVEREPGSPAARQALAEAILYEAAAANVEAPGDPRLLEVASREARVEVERALARAGQTSLRAEALATLGNSWFLEGDRGKASRRYEEALQCRPGLPPQRAVEVAQTLAWLSFLEGDARACARWLHEALDQVEKSPPDASALIPRWEYLHMQLWAFAGEPLSVVQLEAREPYYQRLREGGMVDHFEYRTTRDMLRRVARLREEGQQHEAIKVLYDDPYGDDLDRVEEEGEMRPRSFISEAVERDQEETLFHVMRAELAREARDWNAAHHWYEEALRLAPANPILQERLSTLP